jgi:hypothetical protein
MNVFTLDPAKLTGIVLLRGGHKTRGAGMCLMEAVAYVTDGAHTDHPVCVSRLLGEMGRTLNDTLPDDLRQLLIPVIPDLPGTVDDGHDSARAYLALDWLIRVHLPTWLDLSPACREVAAKVRSLDQIVDMASAERAGLVVRNARQTANAAAKTVAWNTLKAVEQDARSSTWNATRSAAADAVWATWATADAAGAADVANAVWAATSAAVVAAGAAWTSADTARAAWSATGAALQPVVVALQISAIELFARMARLGHEQPTA